MCAFIYTHTSTELEKKWIPEASSPKLRSNQNLTLLKKCTVDSLAGSFSVALGELKNSSLFRCYFDHE
jgi:hypothetical protein